MIARRARALDSDHRGARGLLRADRSACAVVFRLPEVPYQWRKRALLGLLSFYIGICEASGSLTMIARMLLLGQTGVLIGMICFSLLHEQDDIQYRYYSRRSFELLIG